MEINPEHALIKKLSAEKDGKAFDEYSSVVFDQALISEGGQLEDPVGFVKRINELLRKINVNLWQIVFDIDLITLL